MENISSSFTNLTKEEQKNIVDELVPSVCSAYCCRDNCDGCFIQELTDKANEFWNPFEME